MRISKRIQAALEATGLPYELEKGSRHIKIKVAGRLVGILPLNYREAQVRTERNSIAQIRRAANELR